MSHEAPATNPAGYESDTSYESERAPQTAPRSQVDPVPSTSTAAAFTTAPAIEDPIRDLQQRERELSRRTEVIEGLLLSFTSMLNLRGPPASASTPVNQFPGQTPPLGTTTTPGSTTSMPEPTTHRPGLLPSFPTFPSTMYSSSFSDSAIREALELVPKFDGHNMPVLQFIRACKRAKELLPLASEAHLVRSLRNKLTGHAYLAVEDKMHDTIDKLTDCLKRAFGAARNPNYYRGQLSVNFMNKGEHIFDYIGRVKDLRSAIIEADQTLFARALTISELAHLDAFTLESFCDGLPPDLRTELRNEGYRNLSDAYDKAVSATRRLERDNTRHHNARGQAPATHSSSAAQSHDTAVRVPPPITILKRGSDLLPRAPAPRPSGPRSVSPFPTKICGYCKRMGHLISECRKRQYNSANGNNFVQPGNSLPASTDVTRRGRPTTRDVLPLAENLPSTSSDPQPGTSQQSS